MTNKSGGAKKLNALFDGLSSGKKLKTWMFWEGDKLEEAARMVREGVSCIEALWFADGRIKLQNGVYIVDDVFFNSLVAEASRTPEIFDLLKEICASRLAGNIELARNE